MTKTFQSVDVASPPSLQTKQHLETDWNLCVICQDISSTDNVVCPGQSKRKDVGIGNISLAENLIKVLNLLPKTLQLNRIDKEEGVETALISSNAKWHKSCRLQFNNTKFERAQKEYKIKVRHVLIIKEKVHQNKEDQQKLVMTKVNVSSVVNQLAWKHSMKLLLFNWIKLEKDGYSYWRYEAAWPC